MAEYDLRQDVGYVRKLIKKTPGSDWRDVAVFHLPADAPEVLDLIHEGQEFRRSGLTVEWRDAAVEYIEQLQNTYGTAWRVDDPRFRRAIELRKVLGLAGQGERTN